MTSILLTDDDTALSGMLSEYLDGEGFHITTAFNGKDCISAIATGQFDAVILDVMLPDMSGIEVLRHIRQSSAVPVIMLTAKGDDVDRVVGLEMGADDYVAKPYYARELVARLRAVLRRQNQGSNPHSTELASGQLSMNVQRREARYAEHLLELTVSEFDLLEALLRSRDQVATKDDLSTSVLGRRRQPYDRSVDVHVSHLRKKLNAASGGQAEIETVRGVGYRLRAAS